MANFLKDYMELCVKPEWEFLTTYWIPCSLICLGAITATAIAAYINACREFNKTYESEQKEP